MKKLLYLLLLVILSPTVYGQTLSKQFDSLKNNSETFKQYKVIEQKKLNKFWSITMDSIKNLKAEKSTVEQKDQAKANEIDKLNETLGEKDQQVQELETQTSTIEVFGADLNKSTFIFLSFFTIGSLIIVLLFLLYQYKDNNRVARQKVKDYEKLNDDFEEYKRKALDKQMKLRRDLQTERNKLEEARNM